MNINKRFVLCILVNIFLFRRVKAQDCFSSKAELRDAVDKYVLDPTNQTSEVALQYGWPMGIWCVDSIQDFSEVFDRSRNLNLQGFNEDISGWKTTSARNMYCMFCHAESFNQPLEGWDTSSVTTMKQMFDDAESFNQPLEGWNTSSVTTMDFMFYGAELFNQPLRGWNTSSVTTMEGMFGYAKLFNQPLEGWDTSKVRTMEAMFLGASAFNQPLGAWDITKVTSTVRMFEDADAFDQDLCGWGQKMDWIVVTTDMFLAATSCPTMDDPNFSNSPPGPFCYACESLPLEDGVATEPFSLQANEEQFFTFEAGQTPAVRCTTQGSNGNAALFVQWGAAPFSSTGSVDCVSLFEGSNEECLVVNTGDEPTLFVLVQAWESFSGLVVMCENVDEEREVVIVNVEVLPFVFCFDVPAMTQSPTESEYEQLRNVTSDYFELVYREEYSESVGDVIFESLTTVLTEARFGDNVPDDRFEVFAVFDVEVTFSVPSGFVQLPTPRGLYFDIRDSGLATYILDYVHTVTPFQSTTTLYLDVVTVEEHHFGFDVPGLTRQLTAEEIEELRIESLSFLEEVYSAAYPTSSMGKSQHPSYTAVGGRVVRAETGAAIPDSRYEFVWEMETRVFFSASAVQADGSFSSSQVELPTPSELYEILRLSDLQRYMTSFVRNVAVLSAAQPDPVVERGTTVEQTPAPTMRPTTTPTMQATQESCPCRRFRLLCRLINFRLCILREE